MIYFKKEFLKGINVMEKGVSVSMAKLKKRVKAGKKLPTIKQFELSDYWGVNKIEKTCLITTIEIIHLI